MIALVLVGALLGIAAVAQVCRVALAWRHRAHDGKIGRDPNTGLYREELRAECIEVERLRANRLGRPLSLFELDFPPGALNANGLRCGAAFTFPMSGFRHGDSVSVVVASDDAEAKRLVTSALAVCGLDPIRLVHRKLSA